MAILMSAENPGGAKLEEHLRDLIGEIEVKCAKIADDPRNVAKDVHRNNRDIIARLRECVTLQEHSQRILTEAMGADRGPTGVPRIGKGSPGHPDVASRENDDGS